MLWTHTGEGVCILGTGQSQYKQALSSERDQLRLVGSLTLNKTNYEQIKFIREN